MDSNWWNVLKVKNAKTSCLAVAAAVFLLEFILIGVVATWHLGRAAAAIHLTIAAMLTAWTVLAADCRKDLRIPMLLTITTLFMGPIGAAGTLVVIASMSRYGRASTSFEEWYAALFPEMRQHSEAKLWEKIIEGQEGLDKSSVAPFSDILFFGTLAQKQELISVLSRSFQPAFAPVLKAALDDSNNAIRVQAASAITLIEDEFMRRSLSLASSVRENPRDPKLLLKLARLHDEYARSGILDRDRERDSRKQALEAYREYLRLNPTDLQARTAIGRLFLLDEKYHEALSWTADAVKDGETSLELILTHLESLYCLHRFDELRRLSTKYSQLAEDAQRISPEAVETLKLWAKPA